MRVLRAALVAALLAALLLPPPAAAGMADRVAATFALMANDFVAAFKPLEGLVVSIEGREIFLDLTEANGAQVGQERGQQAGPEQRALDHPDPGQQRRSCVAHGRCL